ncbi:MAG: hypothetical protein V3V08_19590 [Nannocystaceae bacterium]
MNVRCHAYQLPAETYRELEPQILEQLGDADRDQLMYLLSAHDLDIPLLSGEWRVLFAATENDFYQRLDTDRRRARMAVSPEELADFVSKLREKELSKDWSPIDFSLAELADALPANCDLVGVVFVEESDNWLWCAPSYEIQAIPADVFSIIEVHINALIEQGDHASLARLCSDHCEAAVEFSVPRWDVLRQHVAERVPELVQVFAQVIAPPSDYTSICEALRLVADPLFQPSLDAWLRVHGDTDHYALYFRDIGFERSG